MGKVYQHLGPNHALEPQGDWVLLSTLRFVL
jgi:hypothetical protein